MAEEKIFVGRKDELEQFKKVLAEPGGQAVLVVGQAGMGKTWLINKMAEAAEKHPELKCGWVRYEVTPTDSVDSTMALMMDNAFETAEVIEKSRDATPRRLEQWRAFLNVFGIGDLMLSLRRDTAKNTREQFLERLRLISKRMPKNGRAVFIIDPEKYMQEKSDQSWAIVVKQLPEKIKFIFAQRPEDVLVDSETFGALGNVVCVPQKRLDVLDETAVDELLDLRGAGTGYAVARLREPLARYRGHPYAIQAALDLVQAGTKLKDLPKDPTGIAGAQWRELSKRGKNAIRLFKAYAVLEVAVLEEVVEVVSELDSDTRQSLVADNYLGGLIRREAEGRRIYHAILADYILEQIGEAERKDYHGRAVEVYREKLAAAKKANVKPDALAAMRLPEHVLAAEGKEAFVDAFVNECFGFLFKLGLLDAATGLSKRALKFVKKGSKDEASVMGNLGIVYKTRGELNNAKKIFTRILKIHKKIGLEKEMASDCANLGGIYVQLGVLDKAEELFKSALEIDQKLGWLEGLAHDNVNLGMIYKKRGDIAKAREYLEKAVELYKKIGMAHMVEKWQKLIEGLVD